MRRQEKPKPFSASSTTSMAPASAGVTEGRRIRSRVSSTASITLVLGAGYARLWARLDRNEPMPKIDIDALPVRSGSGYPAPFDQPCLGRTRRALGDAVGIDQF